MASVPSSKSQVALRHQNSVRVSDERICDHLRKRIAVKKWVESMLDIKGKLEEDLHKSFRNGVILCYLMTELDERSIPRIQESTTIEFRLKENIQFFIHAAQEYGVPHYKMFSVTDLFNGQNLSYVVECIYAIGELAKQKGVAPAIDLPPNSGSTADDKLLGKLSEQERHNIQHELSKLKSNPSGKQRPKVSPLIMKKKLELIAGNPKDYAKMEKGFLLFQALVRGHVAREKKKKIVRALAIRENVAREILSTEKSYHDSIERCIKYYMKPLREGEKPILERQDVHTIFGDMEQILLLSSGLLEDIQPIVEKWGKYSKIGLIFIKISDFLKSYRNYIGNFDQASRFLSTAETKNKKFAKFLQDTTENPALKGLNIHDYLIMPIQRIPRYELLLKELLKHTWSDHPDYQDLQQASKKISEIGQDLNHQKNIAENYSALIKIRKLLDGRPPITASGDIIVSCHVFRDQKDKEVELLLLNNKLIYGMKTSKDKMHLTHVKMTIFSMKWIEDVSLKDITIQFENNILKINKNSGKKLILTLKAAKGHESDLSQFAEALQKGIPVVSKEEIAAPDLKGAEELLKQKKKDTLRRSHIASETPSQVKKPEEIEEEIKNFRKEIKKLKTKEEKAAAQEKLMELRVQLDDLKKPTATKARSSTITTPPRLTTPSSSPGPRSPDNSEKKKKFFGLF